MDIFYSAKGKLKAALLQCPSFLTWLNVSFAQAYALVFLVEGAIPDITPSFAVVTYMEGNFSMNRDSEGGGNQAFATDRGLTLLLEKSGTTAQQATVDALAGSIVSELVDRCHVGDSNGYPIIDSIDYIEGVYDQSAGKYSYAFKVSIRS